MQTKFRAFAKRVPFATSAARLIRRSRSAVPQSPRPVILMYHRIVSDGFDPWGLCVSPEAFAAQLKWLAGNRSVLPLAEFAARHADGSLTSTAVALTFDDGYACFAATAAPLLEREQLPATVFLPPDLIDSGQPFWWDELQSIVLCSNSDSIRLEGVTVPLGSKNASDDYWRPHAPASTLRQVAFKRLWAILRPKSPADLAHAMSELREQTDVAPIRGGLKRPMTSNEVRGIGGGRTDLGSHALSHPWLPSLSSAERRREIQASVHRCQEITGTRPSSFAYPYGGRDKESEAMVVEAGFLCAVVTQDQAVNRKSSVFALPRVSVYGWSARQLERRLRQW